MIHRYYNLPNRLPKILKPKVCLFRFPLVFEYMDMDPPNRSVYSRKGFVLERGIILNLKRDFITHFETRHTLCHGFHGFYFSLRFSMVFMVSMISVRFPWFPWFPYFLCCFHGFCGFYAFLRFPWFP